MVHVGGSGPACQARQVQEPSGVMRNWDYRGPTPIRQGRILVFAALGQCYRARALRACNCRSVHVVPHFLEIYIFT